MKEILETHPVANLKKILKEMKQQIGSYSKMKKAELVARILELKKKGFPVPKVEMYKKPKKAEPKKEEPKLKNSLTFNGESISLTKIMNMALSLEQLNKNYKIFLQDFKKGKTKFGRKIALTQYKEELDKLKKELNDTDKISRKAVTIGPKTLKEEYTPQFKREVNNLISERNKIARLYNRYIRRYNGLGYLTDYESK
jgi:DNA-binding transcriptional MerR regulator